MLPTAVDYDLRLSVLLKGARGVGKQTTTRWVAQKAGIHLLEVSVDLWNRSLLSVTVLTARIPFRPKVNCYDVVGDSDVKTEGTLRSRMEKAADCSPCILLLRHIEALARNTQTLETGKGLSPWGQLPCYSPNSTILSTEPPITTVLQDCLDDMKQTWILTGYPVFVFATSVEPEKIPQGVLSCFKHEITFEVRNRGRIGKRLR